MSGAHAWCLASIAASRAQPSNPSSHAAASLQRSSLARPRRGRRAQQVRAYHAPDWYLERYGLQPQPDTNPYQLHEAASTARQASQAEAAIKSLVAAGHRVDRRSPPDGWTPLHFAAANESSEASVAAIRALLDAGADLTIRDHAGRTPLAVAAQRSGARDAVDAMGALLDCLVVGDEYVQMSQAEFDPLRRKAAYASAADPVRALLAGGARLDSYDRSGQLPIHLAVQHCPDAGTMRGVLCALLAAGADPHAPARDCRGFSALRYAEAGEGEAAEAALQVLTSAIGAAKAEGGAAAPAVVESPPKRLELFSVLDHASPARAAAAARALLEAGADVNACGPGGSTLLHEVAGFCRNADMVQALVPVLLLGGADLRAEDHEGRTPLLSGMDNRYELAGLVAVRLISAGPQAAEEQAGGEEQRSVWE